MVIIQADFNSVHVVAQEKVLEHPQELFCECTTYPDRENRTDKLGISFRKVYSEHEACDTWSPKTKYWWNASILKIVFLTGLLPVQKYLHKLFFITIKLYLDWRVYPKIAHIQYFQLQTFSLIKE